MLRKQAYVENVVYWPLIDLMLSLTLLCCIVILLLLLRYRAGGVVRLFVLSFCL